MTASVFARSPTTRRSMASKAGWRSRLPLNRLRVSMRLASRNPVSSFLREAGVLAHGDHEAEPGGVGVRRRLRQDQAILVGAQRLDQPGVVAPAGRDELVEPCQLGAADGRLHVGDLQVVAELRVDVLVVVAERQRAELLAEALAAGVVLAARAAAVAAPVAHRSAAMRGELVVVGVDRAALAHGHVVRRIED